MQQVMSYGAAARQEGQKVDRNNVWFWITVVVALSTTVAAFSGVPDWILIVGGLVAAGAVGICLAKDAAARGPLPERKPQRVDLAQRYELMDDEQ